MTNLPNIVIFLSDQHSPFVLGAAGDPHVRTPHLDRLAERGTRFEGTYCPSPLCSPSRMAILTGRHTSDIDVLTNNCALPSSTPTFLHALATAGYETVLCGRMHFNGPDQRHGFERRIVPEVNPALKPLPRRVTGLGMTHDSIVWSGSGNTVYIDYDRAVAEAASEFVRSRSDHDRPFCLVVGFVLPHCPFIAPKESYDRLLPLMVAPEPDPDELVDEHPVLAAERQKYFAGIDPDDARRSRAAYYALVEEIDTYVGQVMAELDDRDLADDTIVIYTSDHGELIGEHGMWWKYSFYEASVRVPMLAAWPGRIPSGHVLDRVTSLLDLGPTLLDLTGAPVLPNADGRSMAKLWLEGADDAWDDVAISELAHEDHSPRRMVRRGRWKLNVFAASPIVQLFDLEADPREVRDLGRDPAYEEVRRELHAIALDGWDPAEMERRLERRLADHRVIAEWERTQYAYRPPGWKALIPERWQPPEGSNRLDGRMADLAAEAGSEPAGAVMSSREAPNP